ncbi:DDX51 helicase, partial [Amia calva]|nr:DDX51 helicase [Amia calva]
MALFLINRYLGDEDESPTDASQARSKVLLAQLQERARERLRNKTPSKAESQQPERDRADQKKSKVREQDSTEVGKKKSKKNSHKVVAPQPDPEETPISQTGLEKSAVDLCSDPDDRRLSIKKGKRKEMEETVANDSDENDTSSLHTKRVKTVAGKKDKKRKLTAPENETQETKAGQTTEETAEKTKEQTAHTVPNNDKNPAESSFTVLGGFETKAVQKVHRVLPQWLAQPDLVHRDIKKNLVPVEEVPGICSRLLKKLHGNGIQHFFPVQAEVIPAVLESVCHGLLVGRGGYRPRDICVSAPTGSGKTLAFVIPVVQALMERVVCEVRALAVLPTKELAQQVCKVFHSYAEGTGLKVVLLIGQKSFAVEQTSLLENSGGTGSRSLADIVVATPGRLVDHINKTSGFSLQHLRYLIIDEADRMIDSMHQAWLSHVVKAVYRGGRSAEQGSLFERVEPGPITAASLVQPQMPLQKLLFSATLTQNPEKLQQLGLYQPRLFTSVHGPRTSLSSSSSAPVPQEKFNFPQGLSEYYVPCTLNKKPLLILHFILRLKFRPVLCFTNSREASHRLYLLVHLFGGVNVAEFSSRLSPNERKKTLKEFEQGKIELLISTDATARGIDISGVKCIINYDAPQFIRTYIHRVGRTARAGKAGLAFTFLLGVQEENFLQMLRDAGSPGLQKQIIVPENLKSLVPRYQETLVELENVIKEERATKRT